MGRVVTRRERRQELEARIAGLQVVIDRAAKRLYEMREEASLVISDATEALIERDATIKTIVDEELWRGDYESSDDYMDKLGFTRQRAQQLRDRVRVVGIIHSIDKMLPIPSDLHSRALRALPDGDVGKVYSRAVAESGGDSPSTKLVATLCGAAMDGVDINDESALVDWKHSRTVDEIVRLYNGLPDGYRKAVIRRISDD